MTTFRCDDIHLTWTMTFRPIGQQVMADDANETHFWVWFKAAACWAPNIKLTVVNSLK